MAGAPTPAPEYPDNLAGAREAGHVKGGNGPPIATSPVRELARKLIEDETYQTNLQKRLNEGTAGAIEIWLWRWGYGDPKKGEDREAEEDRRRFTEMRSSVLVLIREHPEIAGQLEDKLLALTQSQPIAIPAHVVEEE